MSFGFGVGDFLAVGELSWKIYKKCKESSGNHNELSNEVLALHGALKETEELLSQQDLTTEQKIRVTTCQHGCEEVLKDLQILLAKYESLGTRSQRTFDRMKFGMQDINALRLRLISNVSMLDSFNNSSSHARLENKLNQLIEEVRAGQREGSIVSSKTFDQNAQDNGETWEALRRELEDIGISPSVIIEKRHFIIAWFQEAVAAGKLEEHASSDLDDSAISLYGSDIAVEEFSLPNLGNSESDINSDSVLAEEMSSVMITQSSQEHITTREALPQIQRPSQQSDSPQYRPSLQKTKNSRLSVSYLLNILRGKDKQFLASAVDGDVAMVEELLEKGADIGVRDAIGHTALHLSVFKDNVVMAQLLIKKGANMEAKSSDGWTPLLVAASRGRKRIVQLLLETGADIESTDSFGQTALLWAARGRHDSTLRLLLDSEADIESKHESRNRALIDAASYGFDSTVQLLLDRGADIEWERYKDRPLIMAATSGKDSVVRLLVERGADINFISMSGWTALLRVAMSGSDSSVELLLDRGADIESKTDYGDTALILAARNDRYKTAQLLIDRGARINARNEKGKTALSEAKSNGHKHMVQKLKSYGAEL